MPTTTRISLTMPTAFPRLAVVMLLIVSPLIVAVQAFSSQQQQAGWPIPPNNNDESQFSARNSRMRKSRSGCPGNLWKGVHHSDPGTNRRSPSFLLRFAIDETENNCGGTDGREREHRPPKRKRNPIRVSSEIELPFSAEVAYEAYSDLTRMPSWSPWLESVEILNNGTTNHNGRVESKWTSRVLGIRYSWTAEAIKNEKPHTIQWRSVNGLRNEGTVRFYHKEGNSYEKGPTMMKLDMVVSTPMGVSSILKRSGKLSRFVEEKMVARSLREFRDVIVLEQHDAKTVAYNDTATAGVY